LFLTKGAAT